VVARRTPTYQERMLSLASAVHACSAAHCGAWTPIGEPMHAANPTDSARPPVVSRRTPVCQEAHAEPCWRRSAHCGAWTPIGDAQCQTARGRALYTRVSRGVCRALLVSDERSAAHCGAWTPIGHHAHLRPRRQYHAARGRAPYAGMSQEDVDLAAVTCHELMRRMGARWER
jgi:hypothetical protein